MKYYENMKNKGKAIWKRLEKKLEESWNINKKNIYIYIYNYNGDLMYIGVEFAPKYGGEGVGVGRTYNINIIWKQ